MEQVSEDALRQQADIEARRLRELQAQEERAQAFRRARQIEAEEAQTKEARDRREAEARDGDISSASARYAIALGENYTIRDPYASLARAAMSEYAMFHRNQERLREQMAQERDPDQRRVIELRRAIEACEYMALTSERLAGISVAIVGRRDAPQAEADRARAADYRAQATALRAERMELIEAIPHRVEATAAERGGVAQSPEAATAGEGQKPPDAIEARTPTVEPATPTDAAPASPRPKVRPAEVAEPAQASSPAPQPGHGAELASPAEANSAQGAVAPPVSVTVSPGLSRPDVIAPPPASRVTLAKDAPETPPEIAAPSSPPERSQADMPWLEALRQRIEEASPSSGEASSERAVARLAKRLQQGTAPPEAANDKGRDDPGPEPDM